MVNNVHIMESQIQKSPRSLFTQQTVQIIMKMSHSVVFLQFPSIKFMGGDFIWNFRKTNYGLMQVKGIALGAF